LLHLFVGFAAALVGDLVASFQAAGHQLHRVVGAAVFGGLSDREPATSPKPRSWPRAAADHATTNTNTDSAKTADGVDMLLQQPGKTPPVC
jgi:hypothetical protein